MISVKADLWKPHTWLENYTFKSQHNETSVNSASFFFVVILGSRQWHTRLQKKLYRHLLDEIPTEYNFLYLQTARFPILTMFYIMKGSY